MIEYVGDNRVGKIEQTFRIASYFYQETYTTTTVFQEGKMKGKYPSLIFGITNIYNRYDLKN